MFVFRYISFAALQSQIVPIITNVSRHVRQLTLDVQVAQGKGQPIHEVEARAGDP
jgi:hypothetical protein